MRAPGSAARPASARERRGSRPPSFRPPGARPVPRTAVFAPNSYASRPAGALGRPSSPWPPRSLPRAYFMLSRGTDYHDLGPTSLERGDRQKVARRLVRKLAELGFQVDLRDAA